jgi:uroporphyrinogen decarboxylase
MAQRETVEAALDFGTPGRIPIGFIYGDSWVDSAEGGTEAERQELRELILAHPEDLDDVGYDMMDHGLHEPPFELGPGQYMDEWGCVWSANAVISHPLADWDALETYQFPDPWAPYHFAGVDTMRAQAPERFLIGRAYSTLFERYRFLRGYEASLTDPYLEPERSGALLDRIAEFQAAIVEQWLTRGADLIAFGDDYGMQDRLFMAPEVWRREYGARLASLFDQARAGGARIGLHADGNVEEILPDLVAMGLALLNPVQKYAMDIAMVGERYGGRLCFHSGVNHQVTMPRGTPEEVRAEAEWLVRTLSRPEGGFIASRGHVLTPDIPLRNALAMYRAFVEFRW